MKFIAPLPYRFNPWKHHLQWILDHIELTHNINQNSSNGYISDNIKSINSNHVDIYTGTLSPDDIIKYVDTEMQRLNIFDKEEFRCWINHKEYQLFTLADSSIWVIREGKEDERYIHFHPARNSPNTIRMHGNSLKTAIVLKLLFPLRSDFSLPDINEIRKKYLGLSPIKDLQGSQRLLKAFKLLGQRQ